MQDIHPLESPPLIQAFITVGIDRRCRPLPTHKDLRWITGLSLLTSSTQQQVLESFENQPQKLLEIVKGLVLAVWFCDEQKAPVSRIRVSAKPSGESIVLQYPSGFPAYEDFLYYQRGGKGSRRIIEDVELMEVAGEESELPGLGESYEVIRLPRPYQEEKQQSSSNQQLFERTRYLLLKTVDLQDSEEPTKYQANVDEVRRVRGYELGLEFKTFHHFCFPNGISIHRFPLGCGYDIFHFVLTEPDASRVYVSCLKFQEELTPASRDHLLANRLEKQLSSPQYLLADRAFCILSRYCYTDFFATLLESLFRSYQSARLSPQPRPSYVRFEQVAEQLMGRYDQAVAQGGESMRWGGDQIQFPEIGDNWMSPVYSARAVYYLFKVLEVKHVVEVVENLLLERKVILVSDSQRVLGYAMEALLSFLYPLRWENPILPILPIDMLDYLEAPMPILAGLSSFLADDTFISALRDTLVVFLDCNQILQTQGSDSVRSPSHLLEARKKLRNYEVFSRAHIAQLLEFREQFDSLRIHWTEQIPLFNPEHIKHIFFEAVLLLIQNYQKYYHPDAPNHHRMQFSFKRHFRAKDFINSQSNSLKPFISRLVHSSHFISFVTRSFQQDGAPQTRFIQEALTNSRTTSPIRSSQRFSEQPQTNSEVPNIRKKLSLPSSFKNFSPEKPNVPQASQKEESTNYSKQEKPSLKVQDVEQQKESKGGHICEAISRVMRKASRTGSTVIFWTQARVSRLRKFFGKEKTNKGEGEDQDHKDV